jgi:hypothetical protein
MQAKAVFLVLVLGAAFVPAVAVRADTTEDDVKWVNQCIADNKREGATEDVVRKYCVCMNNKMGNDETRSVTEWEKTHETERAECDAEAGWK